MTTNHIMFGKLLTSAGYSKILLVNRLDNFSRSCTMAGDLSISAGLVIDTESNAVITGKFYVSDLDLDQSSTIELKISSSGMDDGFYG